METLTLGNFPSCPLWMEVYIFNPVGKKSQWVGMAGSCHTNICGNVHLNSLKTKTQYFVVVHLLMFREEYPVNLFF